MNETENDQPCKFIGRNSRPEVFFKKGVLRNSLLKKETLAQVFSSEFCGIFASVLLKVNNRDIRKRYEICSNLTI